MQVDGTMYDQRHTDGPFSRPTRMVGTSAGQLATYEIGSGAGAVVLWPAIFTDASIYADMVSALAHEYRVIVIEGPGHGRSSAPRSGTGLPEHGEALLGVMDAYSIRRAAIVGTSWGGLVAGEAALLSPDRVTGIVFFNTPFFTDDQGPGMEDRGIVLGARLMLGSRIFIRGVARSFFLPDTIAGNGASYVRFVDHLKRADRRALSRSVRSVLIERQPLAPRLHRISAPSLVVAGRGDRMYPLSQLERAAASLPNGTFSVLETSHISPVDAPVGSRRLAIEFLATVGSGRGASGN